MTQGTITQPGGQECCGIIVRELALSTAGRFDRAMTLGMLDLLRAASAPEIVWCPSLPAPSMQLYLTLVGVTLLPTGSTRGLVGNHGAPVGGWSFLREVLSHCITVCSNNLTLSCWSPA